MDGWPVEFHVSEISTSLTFMHREHVLVAQAMALPVNFLFPKSSMEPYAGRDTGMACCRVSNIINIHAPRTRSRGTGRGLDSQL